MRAFRMGISPSLWLISAQTWISMRSLRRKKLPTIELVVLVTQEATEPKFSMSEQARASNALIA